ncbi:MAG: DUF2950 family protein [Verrucomicrobia bacterium]|nr:DUF2950 family protein [Verrucomicrobiota bacterium]
MKARLSLPAAIAFCLRHWPIVGLLLAVSIQATAAPPQQFPTPEAAVTALEQAVATANRAALDRLFGDAAQQLVNPDEVQGATELADFSAAFQASHRLVRESDSRLTLEVGLNGWPFPIPLVKFADLWQFDTQAGVEELLNRRIGRNELAVLRVLGACAEAQREYASRDRDGDEVLEYAQRITSSPNQTDGLFWPPALNGEISPLGPLMAYAQGEGYSTNPETAAAGPRPFHGYLFRILTGQGRHAPGGKYDYVINGNMIGGFALVAWPAEYGESGVMTFVLNQQGRVYQRDLGPKTGRLAARMKAYDPDAQWSRSRD